MNTNNSINFQNKDQQNIDTQNENLLKEKKPKELIEKVNKIFESLGQVKVNEKIYFDKSAEKFGISGTDLTNNVATNTLDKIPGLTPIKKTYFFQGLKNFTNKLAQQVARTYTGEGVNNTIQDLKNVDEKLTEILEETKKFASSMETMDPFEWRIMAGVILDKLDLMKNSIQSAKIGMNHLCKTYAKKEEKIQIELKNSCQKLQDDGEDVIKTATEIILLQLNKAEEKILSQQNINKEEITQKFEQPEEIISSAEKEIKEGIIHYKKGKEKTQDLIPTKKKPIGKGQSGTVHVSINSPTQIVKKSMENLEKEFEIGKKLNHPNIMKTHQLFIKKYSNYDKYKLVSDKIEGTQLKDIYNSYEKNSTNLTLHLIEQAQDCCLYLFDQNVIWKDVNDENIFITNDSNQLKIIDFGYWEEEENPIKKTYHLFLGAMELCGWLVKSSALRSEGKKPELEKEILFPNLLEEWPYQVLTAHSSFENPPDWAEKLIDKIKESTKEEDQKQFIINYFDHVKKTYEKIALELGIP